MGGRCSGSMNASRSGNQSGSFFIWKQCSRGLGFVCWIKEAITIKHKSEMEW